MGCQGCLFLVLMVSCISARSLAITDAAAAREVKQSSNEATEPSPVHEVLCVMCQNFASKAMNYLADNKTRTGIINGFHKSCSTVPYLYRQSCISLVDYYLSLLFEKIDSVKPELFCETVNICGKNATAPLLSGEAACSACQNTASQMLVKLRDHGTELKNVIMEYAPLVMSNTESFIEKTPLCTNVCKAPQQVMFGPQLGTA